VTLHLLVRFINVLSSKRLVFQLIVYVFMYLNVHFYINISYEDMCFVV